jgi:Lrp/AsnC family leucine-responsive transcriptional regulator
VTGDSDALDAIDQELLDLLAEDARLPATELGEKVRLSASAVRKRLKHLEGTHILKYTTVRALDKAGQSAEAYIELDTAPRVDALAFVERVVRMQGVREASQLAGKPDVLLRVRARTPEEIGDLVNKIRELKEVEDTKTLIALHRQRHVAGGRDAMREPGDQGRQAKSKKAAERH